MAYIYPKSEITNILSNEPIIRYQKLKEEICRLLSDNQNKANSVFNTYNRFKLPDVLEQNEFLKTEIWRKWILY